MVPRFWVKAPALTAKAFFGEDDGHGHESDGHGDHENYDQTTLRRAIVDGIDPAGEPLDEAMPRWSMSEADLNDLITYLQQ
ncbi:MAG: hypothetical protein OEQ39_06340 [Gammaproteobacteria bacterium]|nr:hypothetical protein [Gammaproteobacteria bacterium]